MTRFNLQRVASVKVGDTILYEEDVFVKKNDKFVFRGVRLAIVSVLKANPDGSFLCKIVKSAGANADPLGAEIAKPVRNLLKGYVIPNDENNLKKGGHLEGMENGEKVILTDASKGGMGVGAKHTEDGIKGVVGTEKKPIEFEGEEIILTAPVSSNPDKYEFEGEQLTGREIASRINVANGGVAFAEGGQANSCRITRKKMYKFGGQAVTDADIINYINFMNKSVEERILALKKL